MSTRTLTRATAIAWLRVPAALAFVLASLALTGCATSGSDSDEALRVRRANSHLNLGLDYIRNDRLALGLRELLAAEGFAPKDPRIQQALGDGYSMRGKPEEAERHYLRTLELDRTFQEARFNLAALYNRLQRYEEAIAECEILAADATFSGPWRALSHKGFAEFQLGRVEEARRSLGLGLEYRPDYWPALLNLGILEMEEGRRVEAVAHFRHVLSQQPDLEIQAQANYRIGEIYVALGERERAIGYLRAAVAQTPGGPWGAKSEEYLKLLR
jgi:tetratricopeptide (TPR) repeat protein